MRENTGYRTAAKGIAWAIAGVIIFSSPLRAQLAVPKYEVDPFWAKFPDAWVVGPLGGVCVDAQDHVFVLHRQEGLTEATLTARSRFDGDKTRIKAPPVMEFDPQGNLVNSWGDAKVLGNYLHDCLVDKEGNVWIAPRVPDLYRNIRTTESFCFRLVNLAFLNSSDGTAKGKPLNSNAAQFFGPSAVDVDPENGDVYVADGHGGGAPKSRYWTRTAPFCASGDCTTPKRKETSRSCRTA